MALVSLTLAFAINAWGLGFIHQVLLRPLAVDASDRVVQLFNFGAGGPNDTRPFTLAEFKRIEEKASSWDNLACFTFTIAGVGEGAELKRGFAVFVSEHYFEVFAARPSQGRFFTAEECEPESRSHVVVVSHEWWERQGRPEGILGRRISVSSIPCTIVGVAPPRFSGLNALFAPDLWLPLGMFPEIRTNLALSTRSRSLLAKDAFLLTLVGRVAATSETSLAEAGATEALRTLSPDRHTEAHPPPRLSIGTSPPDEEGLGALAAVVIGLGLVVLLAACVNLANLALARATARQREFAIRRSLGASRLRIVRQLLVEGAVLAGGAGVIGYLAAGYAAERGLAALQEKVPIGLTVLPPEASVAWHTGVLLLLVFLASATIGLLPGLRLARQSTAQLARSGDDTSRAWHEGKFLRGLLVIFQVASSVVLLFTAQRLYDAAQTSARVPLGFETEDRVTVEIDLGIVNHPVDDRNPAALRMLDAALAVPGVERAALASLVPLTNFSAISDVRRAEDEDVGSALGAIRTEVSPGYFETLGIPLVEGRDFSAEDGLVGEEARVAIVNEALAERLFRDEGALGRHLRLGEADAEGKVQDVEVVGIVGDTRHDGVSLQAKRQLYLPFGPVAVSPVFLHVLVSGARTASESAAGLQRDLSRAVQSAVPGAPVVSIRPLGELIQQDIGALGLRACAHIAALLASMAVFLTLVGVYGVKAYAVNRRAREIGIRVALGARPEQILRLLLWQTVAQLSVGLGLGCAAAYGAGVALDTVLIETPRGTFEHLLPAVFLIAASAGLATWVPVRRALRIQPATILRTE